MDTTCDDEDLSDFVVVKNGGNSNRDLMALIKSNSINKHTDELTHLFLPQNTSDVVENLNVTNSSNVHVGNVINVKGSVKVNQFIIENATCSEFVLRDCNRNDQKRKIATTVLVNNDNNDDDKQCFNVNESNISGPYNNLIPGIHVITKDEWKARPSGPMDPLESPVEYIVIAHTVSETCPDRISNLYQIKYIQSTHIDLRRWPDISYNFLIGGDGAIYEGRGWDFVGSHSRNFNSKCICIALVGTFCKVVPPQKQLDGVKNAIELCRTAGKITEDYKLIGHRQVIPTLSPGDALFEEIKKWPHYCEGQISYPK